VVPPSIPRRLVERPLALFGGIIHATENDGQVPALFRVPPPPAPANAVDAQGGRTGAF